MNTTIREQVLPLVGKVKMPNFHKDRIGNVLSLQMKMVKHTNSPNHKKLKMYLAFCMQEWPKVDRCPIDMEVVKNAIEVLQS